MRLNKYIAQHTHYSRRAADELISEGRVRLNDKPAQQGSAVSESDIVKIDGKTLGTEPQELLTVILNKPRGYVCSRRGQGSNTIYELLPENLIFLNSVGRLDKDSSGLILMTNDGELANRLTHPRYDKVKVYDIQLDKTLQPLHQQIISDKGLQLEDGTSRLQIEKLDEKGIRFRITMTEGRNRQIRRTFEALGYAVKTLHRIQFGDYLLGDLAPGQLRKLN
jgi:23S rRNA pseudouridine2605 synthase